MSARQNLVAALPSGTEIHFPSSDQQAQEILNRWSDTGIKTPFAIVVPTREADIVAAVKFAATEHLQVVCGGGGRGCYVSVGSQILYLDLKRFNSIRLDNEKGTVCIGGGATAGAVSKACAAQGRYTLLPVASSVGVAGAILGGLASPLSGLHGLGADHVASIEVVTADGNVMVLSPTDEPQAGLFRVLGRTGYGFGVITSMTLDTWPTSNLGMKDDKVWARTLVFPGTAIDTAAKLYCQLQPPHPRLQSTLIFARMAKDGPASVTLASAFYGAEEEANQAAAPLLSQDAEQHAVVALTNSVPVPNVNDKSEHLNAPRHFKEMYTCMLKQTDSSSISDAFRMFSQFGDEQEDASPSSYMIISGRDTEAAVKNAALRNEMMGIRDRVTLVQATAWYTSLTTKPAADQFGTEVVRIMRQVDDKAGVPKRTLAHNLRLGQDLREFLSEDMIAEYLKLKTLWDPANVFWSPITDREHFSH